MSTVQVRVRLPKEHARQIDEWVTEGKFHNRSDAINAIVTLYNEREKTRKFFAMLEKRNKQSREKPETLVPFDAI